MIAAAVLAEAVVTNRIPEDTWSVSIVEPAAVSAVVRIVHRQ